MKSRGIKNREQSPIGYKNPTTQFNERCVLYKIFLFLFLFCGRTEQKYRGVTDPVGVTSFNIRRNDLTVLFFFLSCILFIFILPETDCVNRRK